MRRYRRLLIALSLPTVLLAGCGFGSSGSGVRTSGEIELTQDQPIMAVEFEASFESLRHAGMYVSLSELRPRSADELLAIETFQREIWGGGAWIPVAGDGPEITGSGLNTFRYRWVIELRDGVPAATVPFEVEINPTWGDGSDEPPPGDEDVKDLAVSVTSIHPFSPGG